jgi:transcriptional regulator with XRE-family HTH domain
MTPDYSLQTPVDVAKTMALKVKSMRLEQKWKQSTLASHSGVTLASLRRFEHTGEISLKSLLSIANALGCLDDFNVLFILPEASSISELQKRNSTSKPKRGSI